MAPPNIALQLTSGGFVVARRRARRHPIGPLAAERGRRSGTVMIARDEDPVLCGPGDR